MAVSVTRSCACVALSYRDRAAHIRLFRRITYQRRQLGYGIANRIIEVKAGGKIVDFKGTYDEYLKSQGVEV